MKRWVLRRFSTNPLLDVITFLLWAGVVALLFAVKYLPMVDMPQHVAQLSYWVHLDDPAFRFGEQFTVNWKTPYLLGYLVARPWVGLLGIVGALKIVVALAALLSLLSWRYLCRQLGQDPWLSLLGLPLSFGFAFYFGFVNFSLATPLVIFSLGAAWAFGENPSFKSGAQLTLCLVLTFLNHGLAFAIAFGSALLIVHGAAKVRTQLVRAYVPFALSGLVLLAWVPGFLRSSGGHMALRERWEWRADRIVELPGDLLAASFQDREARLGGIALLLVLLLAVGRWSGARPWWTRGGPLLVALLGYLFFPYQLRGVAFLYERFAVFVPVGLLVLAGQGRPWLAEFYRRSLVATFAAGWLLFFGGRLLAFAEDSHGYDTVVQGVPSAPYVRPLIVERESAAFPGLPVFLHFPAYLQAEKGGYYGYSFGRYFTNFVHYKQGVPLGMIDGMEWFPDTFSAAREARQYNVYVARASGDAGPFLFRGAPCNLHLESALNGWWRYSCRFPKPSRVAAPTSSP